MVDYPTRQSLSRGEAREINQEKTTSGDTVTPTSAGSYVASVYRLFHYSQLADMSNLLRDEGPPRATRQAAVITNKRMPALIAAVSIYAEHDRLSNAIRND